jgi:hypothetical protein
MLPTMHRNPKRVPSEYGSRSVLLLQQACCSILFVISISPCVPSISYSKYNQFALCTAANPRYNGLIGGDSVYVIANGRSNRVKGHSRK